MKRIGVNDFVKLCGMVNVYRLGDYVPVGPEAF